MRSYANEKNVVVLDWMTAATLMRPSRLHFVEHLRMREVL
jgi:hypothetical protein